MIPRQSFFASACVSPLDGRLGRVHGVTSDLSVDGAFVTTAAAASLPVGTLVLLSLYSPHGTFRGLARVVHRSCGCGLGCELLDLRQEQYLDLCQLIASREVSGARCCRRRCRWRGAWGRGSTPTLEAGRTLVNPAGKPPIQGRAVGQPT